MPELTVEGEEGALHAQALKSSFAPQPVGPH